MNIRTFDPSLTPGVVLSRHGRTFWWASRVLAPSQRGDVEQLYAFCRCVDDIADASPDSVLAAVQLGKVIEALDALDASHAVAGGVVGLIQRGIVPAAAARALVQTLAEDTGQRALTSEAQLLAFAYGAAGTVGEMMTRLLGGGHPNARPFAIDLGVAMQLTNIARDVITDAALQRLYLPAEWMQGEVSCEALLSAEHSATQRAIAATERVLKLADRYYASARLGYRFLPPRARAAVAIAARSYQAIGAQLLRRDRAQWWLQREVITPTRRASAIAAGTADALRPSLQPSASASRDTRLLAW